MATKKCSACGARNKVDAKKCVKCGESFERIGSSFVQGTAWSAADQYENPDDPKNVVNRSETEPFWRTILIIGIIFTATLFLIGFGVPMLVMGIYGIKQRISESKPLIKLGIVAGSVVLGIIVYKFVLFPLFT